MVRRFRPPGQFPGKIKERLIEKRGFPQNRSVPGTAVFPRRHFTVTILFPDEVIGLGGVVAEADFRRGLAAAV